MLSDARIVDLDGQENDGGPFLVSQLSWVSYLREIPALLIRFLLCGGVLTAVGWLIDHLWSWQTMIWMPTVGLGLALLWTVYSVVLTNSVRLFTDDAGVWMQSGVLPWERGVTGVQWRDLGQASYTQGFMSWILASYNVRVSHRFTTGAELYVRNVHRGNLFVEHINSVMVELQGRLMPTGVGRIERG